MTRTIPDEAWLHARNSTLRDGVLYPDLWHWEGKTLVYDECDDPEVLHWLSFFTLDNYTEWASATVMCPRAPRFEDVLFRFDDVAKFIELGYRNPFREPGTPDWYFFWVRNFTRTELEKWARAQGLLPAKDLTTGRGGSGAGTGLRGLRDGLVSLPQPNPER